VILFAGGSGRGRRWVPTRKRFGVPEPKGKSRIELVTQFIGDRTGMVESAIRP